MDIILELFDTFILDTLYAAVLPAPASKLAQSSAWQNASVPHKADMLAATQWRYEPATQFLTLTPGKAAYMSVWARDNAWRQFTSLFLITWLFGIVIYFVCASLSYFLVFDKTTFNHPKYLRNQMRMEMRQSLSSFPFMALLTAPFFLAEVRGWSKMYDSTAQGPGAWYDVLQFPLFILFTDACIYWIHRGLHHPRVYRRLHKPHHKWIMPTPFASHAFHPVDGWAQSLPYHVFPFLFPLQKFAYVLLFVFINIWTVMIHDGEYVSQSAVVNGAACHTMHHLYFNYNYGQFTTLWDRMGGSYRKPNDELFRRDAKTSAEEWAREARETESMVRLVEGDDDRTYLPATAAKKTQ